MAALTTSFFCRASKKIFYFRYFSLLRRSYSTKENKNAEEIDLTKPIQFSTSKAATWKAEHSFSGSEKEDVSPWYQPQVICLSLAVFLIYFGILREENDIDEQLGMSLYDRVEDMEEVQLNVIIQYYKENDKQYDRTVLEKRLLEIQELKKAKLSNQNR